MEPKLRLVVIKESVIRIAVAQTEFRFIATTQLRQYPAIAQLASSCHIPVSLITLPNAQPAGRLRKQQSTKPSHSAPPTNRLVSSNAILLTTNRRRRSICKQRSEHTRNPKCNLHIYVRYDSWLLIRLCNSVGRSVG
ncbi:unnamed protein product [Ceratitis capitata]|uniref:(Mediterranean fruit fly) hypothetical protein n=1 Tax=Ceratitis capitata TaxID=7213 RepID=A0A811V7N3_CERCA|nr:unnamed protein product [Ceratitis capitata]